MYGARWVRDVEKCPTHGVPRTVCHDPEVTWYPQRTIDYAAMNQAGAVWRYEQAHKQLKYHDGTFKAWSAERSPQFPFHFNDGVRIWVSQENHTPDDKFLTNPDLLEPDDEPEHDEQEGGDHGNTA